MGRRPLSAVRDFPGDSRKSTYDVSVLGEDAHRQDTL
jgi:hypothetical protein